MEIYKKFISRKMRNNKIWHIIRVDPDSKEFKTLCGIKYRVAPLTLWWGKVNCEECLKIKKNG